MHDAIDGRLLETLIERYEADPKAKKNSPIRKIFGFGRSKSFKEKESSYDTGLMQMKSDEELKESNEEPSEEEKQTSPQNEDYSIMRRNRIYKRHNSMAQKLQRTNITDQIQED